MFLLFFFSANVKQQISLLMRPRSIVVKNRRTRPETEKLKKVLNVTHRTHTHAHTHGQPTCVTVTNRHWRRDRREASSENEIFNDTRNDYICRSLIECPWKKSLVLFWVIFALKSKHVSHDFYCTRRTLRLSPRWRCFKIALCSRKKHQVIAIKKLC